MMRDFISGAVPLGCPLVVTNPPHGDLLTPFLVRGLQLLDRQTISALVLLFRWDHLTAMERAHAFNRAAGILQCIWRARLIPGTRKNGRWTYAWVWWLPGCAGPPPTHFLPPEHRRGDLLAEAAS
jgi:hypothetical protein